MTTQTLEDQAQETASKTATAVRDRAGAAAAGASSVLEQAKSVAGDAGARIEDAARRVGSQAGEIGEQAYAGSQRIARTVARQVEEQPLAPLLIAGAVGVAIGYALARR